MGKILVIGSTNMDIIAMVDHLPVPGETIGNGKLARAHGGRGANQAVAAARAGGEVTFITCIGDDDDGKNCIAVAPGANNYLSKKIIDKAEELIKDTDLILLQREIPFVELLQYLLWAKTRILLSQYGSPMLPEPYR